ncbi:MAG: outer membrane beta-barrel protein [Cryomorphaceae bacterium]|nr:outer membrane beta-barrel protein [Cryomorphaceae bacterium]
MKKLIYSAVIFMGAFCVQGQFDQGSILLTGDFNFNSMSAKTTMEGGGQTNTVDLPGAIDFGLSVGGGYFVVDNLAVGLGIGYGMNSTKIDGDDGDYNKFTASMFMLNPFARYYISYSDRFAFFTQMDLGLGFGGIKDEERIDNVTTTEEQSLSTFIIGLSPGFTYFLNDKIALDMRVGFIGFTSTSQSVENENFSMKDQNSNFGLELGLNTLTFGLTVFL